MNFPARYLCRNGKFLSKNFAILNRRRYTYKIVSRPNEETLKNPVFANAPSVASLIFQRIKLAGPITVAEYMKQVLTNSTAGYYMNKDMFGERGDFITSPEINQIFGETLGIWLVNEWSKLGMPKPLQIVEFGPGKGTLVSDVLKVFRQIGLESNDISVHLIEISPTLQRLQADRLCAYHKEAASQSFYHEGESVRNSKVFWYRDIDKVPKGFSLIIAHEFFDALPIHKLKKTAEGWREILVDIDFSNDDKTEKFRYTLSKEETVATKLYSNLAQTDSVDFEVSPEGMVIAKKIATRIEEDGGIGIIIDYGKDGPTGDTFRAFKNHTQVDPLIDAGNADLTADVNFALLKESAREAKVMGPISQRNFLLSSHANIRLKALLEKAKPEQHEDLKASYNMLVESDKMGERFQFMTLFPTITEDHYKKYPVTGFSN